MRPATAAVIVASRDRPAMLSDLLCTILSCRPLPDELIIVDDGSQPPLAPDLSSLQALIPRVRLLRNREPLGPGAARNLGVHASRSDLLLFTDDDCLVDSSWVGALKASFNGESKPPVGGVGGQVRAHGSDIFSRYYDFHRILEPRPHDADNPCRLPYLVTANCAILREAYMQAGGFDGRIHTAGGEDAALSIRVVKRGYVLHRAPDALVHHRYRPSIADFAKTFYRYGLGGRYVVDRYLPL